MNRGLAAFVFLAALPVTALAGEVRAQFSVAAEVAPRASLETIAQPATISVSDADIARGYVEVDAVYRVRNNDPRGYLLRLEPRVGYACGIVVTGLAAAVAMQGETVEVVAPAALVPQVLALTFRVMLAPTAAAGLYALPVRVSAATL